MQLQNWPTITDAVTPTDTNATRLDGTLYRSIKDSFEDNFDSLNNPSMTGANLIDEVVTARGSKSSLDERLSVSIKDDGTLDTPASLMTTTQLREVPGRTNMVRNGDFEIWALGATSAPSHWNSWGAPTFQVCGIGETDTENWDSRYTCKIVHSGGAADEGLYQNIIGTTPTSYGYDKWLDGQKITVGAWVKSSVAGQAMVLLYDGTASSTYIYTSGTGWEWLSTTLTYTKGNFLRVHVGLNKNSGATAYFSGVTVTCGNEIAPGEVIRPNSQLGTYSLQLQGKPSIDGNHSWVRFPTPVKVIGWVAYCKTAPTATAIQGNLYKWDGAWSRMHVANPQDFLGVGQYYKRVAMNSGYIAKRSLNAGYGSDASNNTLRIELTQTDVSCVKFNIDIVTWSYGHFESNWWEDSL
jgi:hypothetical protein